jgi:Fic family protein
MYKPNYTISDELLVKIAEIERNRTKVDGSHILPEREIEMRYRATVEASHSSTSIEGNPLSLKQVEAVLSSKEQITRHQYAEIEVKNYKKALDYVEKCTRAKKPIELPIILTIHKIIMSGLLPAEKVGNLRGGDIYIADQNDKVLYTGPKAAALKLELDELLEWLEDAEDIHPVIAAAILHYQFVSIHPFSDGNGRTTRALTTLYLGLRDYDLRSSLVLDTFYSVDKSAYYSALSLADNYRERKSANLNHWLDYFVDGFLSAAKVLLAEIALLSKYIEPIYRDKINRDDADLLSYAKQFGGITLAEAEDILPAINRRTLQRKLRKLVDTGYLQMTGSARDTKYILAK